MNFKGNFRKISNHDISQLKEQILRLTDDEWDEESWRQKHYDVHKHTHTISLIFDRDFRHKNPTVLPRYEQFQDNLAPIITKINAFYNQMLKYKKLKKKNGSGYIIRINIVKLDASGGDISPHVDNLFTLSHSHRIHIPIITNDSVNFSIGNEIKNLKQGEIWEVNNRQMHSVVNDGKDYRVHIIIDWVIPGERCCCGQKHRPRGECNPIACEKTDHVVEACSCYS
jgi:hypothetical protein